MGTMEACSLSNKDDNIHLFCKDLKLDSRTLKTCRLLVFRKQNKVFEYYFS